MKNGARSLKKISLPGCLNIVRELARYSPPAAVFDKSTYRLGSMGVSPGVATGGWSRHRCDYLRGERRLRVRHRLGRHRSCDRVIVVSDAVCSGTHKTYDGSMTMLGDRFSVHLELTATEEFLSAV
jgi:hypothetical protein